MHKLSPASLWPLAAALTLASGAIGCYGPETRVPAAPAFSLPATLAVRVNGRITRVPLEDYVLGSALAEVTPVGEAPATTSRIYEVQAILARTYAAAHLGRHRADGFDLCDGTHCQLYGPGRIATSRFASLAREAVRRTAGRILTYGQRPAEALFHADCGGSTSAAETVWGRPVPYLLSILDQLPLAAHRSWKLTLTSDQLRTALNKDDRSRVGRTLDRLEVRTRDAGGRASQVYLSGERATTIRAEDFRAVTNETFGDRAVQSTRFTVTRTGRSYVFDGQGLGHGVGLCQLGAAARARRGDSIESILQAYFRGTRLTHP